MTVDLDRVECRSAFERAPDNGRTLRLADGFDVANIRVIDVEDVLYLPHVLEPGQSLCLMQESVVPAESVLDCWSVEFFRTTRQRNPALGLQYREPFAPEFIDDRVCILGNLFSRNFGHWTEELLKVALLEASGERCSFVVPALPSFAEDSLRLIGVGDDRLHRIDRPTRFAKAVFLTAVSHQNIARYPYALECLRTLIDRCLGTRPGVAGSRLWAERGEMLRSGGRVTNRDEVYRLLETYEFDVVDLATMSVEDQLRTVHNAKALAGPHGAQFVHAQFMPPRSVVVECFSPVHVNPSILQICRVLGHSYHQVVARSHLIEPYARGRDCEVDCEHLALVFDSCLRR